MLTAEQRLYCAIFGALPGDAGPVPKTVWLVLGGLSPREQIVLQLRFGRFGQSNTLRAVGDVLGVTPERIRQIEARALRRLRHPSRSRIIQAMCQGQDWTIADLKREADFYSSWMLSIQQARAQGMKPYAAMCLKRLVYHLETQHDYRRLEDLGEAELCYRYRCGIGPVTLREIQRFLPIGSAPRPIVAPPGAPRGRGR